METVWRDGKVWGSNESTANKRGGTVPRGSSYILDLAGEHLVKVLYDNLNRSVDGEIPYENFTLDIIDPATGEYPTWLYYYETVTPISTSSELNPLRAPGYPDTTPPGYSTNGWMFVCKWNCLQDTDTNDRSIEITFTESETGESVTHVLTQESSVAANNIPLNLTVASFNQPTVNQSSGDMVLTFDKDDTFIGFGYPGDTMIGYNEGDNPGQWFDGLQFSDLYYDGQRVDPEWLVVIIDPITGLEATWVTYTGANTPTLLGTDKMSITFNFDFEQNTTGTRRYFEVFITESNHNETIGPNTILEFANPNIELSVIMYQPNR